MAVRKRYRATQKRDIYRGSRNESRDRCPHAAKQHVTKGAPALLRRRESELARPSLDDGWASGGRIPPAICEADRGGCSLARCRRMRHRAREHPTHTTRDEERVERGRMTLETRSSSLVTQFCTRDSAAFDYKLAEQQNSSLSRRFNIDFSTLI